MWIAAYIAGAALSIVAWRTARWYFSRAPAPEQAVCGSCGYSVEGLPSRTCPECGQDLDVVGVQTRRRFQPSPGIRLAATFLGFTLTYGLAVGLLWVPFNEALRPGTLRIADGANFFSTQRAFSWQVSRDKKAAMWPWERDAFPGTINTPDIWRVDVFESCQVGLCQSGDTVQREAGAFSRDPKRGRHEWMDPVTHACGTGSGDYQADLGDWLSRSESNLKEPGLRARVLTVLPVALTNPFGARFPATYAGIVSSGFFTFAVWDADPLWAQVFWVLAVGVYLVRMLQITRASAYSKALASQAGW